MATTPRSSSSNRSADTREGRRKTPFLSLRFARPAAFAAAAFPALAGAADLGQAEWPHMVRGDCIVIDNVSSRVAQQFSAAFSRHWCLQGWASNSQVILRESAPVRWVTQVDILRNDELLLSVPMSPYVERNVEAVGDAVVAQISAWLLQADRNTARAGAAVPGTGQPGGERK